MALQNRAASPSILSVSVVVVVTVLLLLLGAPTPVSGQTCYLDNMPVLTLAYQPYNQTFVRVNRTRSLLSSSDASDELKEEHKHQHRSWGQRQLQQPQPRQRRHLRHLESLPLPEPRRFVADTATGGASNNGSTSPPLSGVLVRHCYCAPNQPIGRYGSGGDNNNNNNNNSAPSAIEFFCPVDLNLCVIPRYYSLPASQRGALYPECYRTTNRLNVVLTMWPIILVWFILVFALSLATVTGRNSWDYLMSSCLPCWNKHIVVPIMIRRDPTRAERLLHRELARNVPPLENGWVVEGTDAIISPGPLGRSLEFTNELVLRTARYEVGGGGSHCRFGKGPTVEKGSIAVGMNGIDPLTCREPPAAPLHDDDDDDGSDDGDGGVDTAEDAADTTVEASSSPSCPICLVPLCVGDRVGRLPCHHAIHADCLKTWLARRNVCPLCLTPDVALPHPSNRSFRSRRPSRPRRRRSATRDTANGNGNVMVSDRRASY